MSEKIYAWFLRLFPSYFREIYGEEALQLFRDRWRDEAGWLNRLRLWLDLLTDLAISIPHQYLYAQAKMMSSSPSQPSSGVPSFSVLRDEPPRAGTLLLGGVLSVVVLAAFSVLLNLGGNYEVTSSVVRESREASGEPAPSNRKQSTQARDAQEAKPSARPAASAEQVKSTDGDPAKVLVRNAPGSPSSQGQSSQTHTPKSAPATAIVTNARVNVGKLDASSRHRVIEGAITNLKEYYVYPDVGQRMADALLVYEKNGDDDASTDGEAFADLLTRQMKDVSHDAHLAVFYVKEGKPDGTAAPTADDFASYRKDMLRTNCTFEKVEILSHNVGYVKFNEFPDPSVCRSTVVAVMKRLNNAQAIIFDVRDNHGGDPRMVSLICSYLFDRPTHLNDIYNRRQNSTEEYWTKSPVAGNKLADKPAFVLTSRSTFSGAEEFSYDLKMLKRATLIGETTGGGAHLASGHRIDDHFRIRVPSGRPINPISKKDWEGTGVEPDVKVSTADALETAKKLAEEKVGKKPAHP